MAEVPNIENSWVRALGRRHRHFTPDHLTFFSPRTLAAMAGDVGLEVVNVYRPPRYLTLGHLVTYWGGRIAPAGLVSRAAAALSRLGWGELVVRVNARDIVAVVARRPA
jgi:hypothetical protein